jgi:hypothetical protein
MHSLLPSSSGKKRPLSTVLEPMQRKKRRKTMVELPISKSWKTEPRSKDDLSYRHIAKSIIQSSRINLKEEIILENKENLGTRLCKPQTPKVENQKTINIINK